MKKFVSFSFKVGLLVVAFLFIFYPEYLGLSAGLFGGIKPIDVWRTVTSAASYSLPLLLFWLAVASAVKIVGIFCGVVRWKLLLAGQGISMPFWYMTYLWFMGRFVGLFLPGTLGLDGWRLVESARYTREWVKCTTVIAIEKLIGFLSLTFLVFITFPLGMQIIDINPVIFGGIMLFLFAFVVFCFTLLFQPRIIQVLVNVLPAPGKVRLVVDRIGAAATAYSQHRGLLILAVFFGLCVHLGTVFMSFFTMVAIRTPNTDVWDILFASPIMIYGMVVTPAISGMGVREIVFGQILGGSAGYDAAVAFGHLGLWTGEIIPLILSVPLLLLGGRPSRRVIEAEMEELRKHAAEMLEGAHLPAAVIARYRGQVYGTLIAGTLGGLIAGAVIGLSESAWLLRVLGAGLPETGMFVWGPLVYGVLFAGVGLGVAGGLLYVFLLVDRFAPWTLSFALGFGGSFAAGGLVIGLFRLKRDVLDGFNPTLQQALPLLIALIVATLVGMAVCWVLAAVGRSWLGGRALPLVGAGMALYFILVGGGAAASAATRPAAAHPPFAPAVKAQGPNIFLIAIDTLRADYLKLFNPQAQAHTPNLEAFAGDGIVYAKAFAQASWTKASFGTIFTGMYPECHTAVTKTASLPQSVETVTELLLAGGYYTQGYSNNPNISGIFGYDQGFVEYVDLRPSLLFGAGVSASKLSMYEVLRAVREKVKSRVPGFRRLNITEYYQPADSVRSTATAWLDSGAVPRGNPFYLFLHFMDPHDPYRAPWDPRGGFGRKQLGDQPDKEVYREQFQRAYNGEIEYLDRYLGMFFEDLKRRGLYDDALIILTADHGEEFCEHGGWWHGQTLYDEQTHIPMIIKLPGNKRAGSRNIYFARNLDLAPTILQFAGLPKGGAMQGVPLLDLAGRDLNGIHVKNVYAENNFEGIVLQSLRSEDGRKLIKANPGNPRNLKPVELYDTERDAQEQNNLAGTPELAAVEQDLNAQINTFLNLCGDAAKAARDANIPRELQEQLDGLGYLGADAPAAAPPPTPEPKKDEVPEELRQQLESLGYVGG